MFLVLLCFFVVVNKHGQCRKNNHSVSNETQEVRNLIEEQESKYCRENYVGIFID